MRVSSFGWVSNVLYDKQENRFGREVHLVEVCGRGCPFCCGAWAVPCPQARQRGPSTSCRKCRGWKDLPPLPVMVDNNAIGRVNKQNRVYTYMCFRSLARTVCCQAPAVTRATWTMFAVFIWRCVFRAHGLSGTDKMIVDAA